VSNTTHQTVQSATILVNAVIKPMTKSIEIIQHIKPVQLDEAPLQSLSKEAGLEWVNTDHAAFATAQAKLLNQPKPVRVPRERPVRVSVTEDKLEMMETNKRP
jgi:ribonuclease E